MDHVGVSGREPILFQSCESHSDLDESFSGPLLIIQITIPLLEMGLREMVDGSDDLHHDIWGEDDVHSIGPYPEIGSS